jgi:acyl carrier protein
MEPASPHTRGSESVSVADEIRTFIFDELMEGQPAEGDPVAEGKLDSLAMEQVIGFIEDTYGITFSDEELVIDNFRSIGTVAELVERKRAAAASGA